MAENKTAPNSFVKDGVYYFVRRVPKDLQHHYTSRKISYSLRTRSAVVASSRAIRASQKLDEFWYHLRIKENDLPGKHMLRLAQANGDVPDGLTAGLPATETVKLLPFIFVSKARERASRSKRRRNGPVAMLSTCAGTRSSHPTPRLTPMPSVTI